MEETTGNVESQGHVAWGCKLLLWPGQKRTGVVTHMTSSLVSYGVETHTHTHTPQTHTGLHGHLAMEGEPRRGTQDAGRQPHHPSQLFQEHQEWPPSLAKRLEKPRKVFSRPWWTGSQSVATWGLQLARLQTW